MQQFFLPILYEHQVHTYWCGHTHSLQHLKNITEPYHYANKNSKWSNYSVAHVISGAGSKTRELGAHKLLLGQQQDSGFVFVDLTPSSMHMQFVNYHGMPTFETRIANPKYSK